MESNVISQQNLTRALDQINWGGVDSENSNQTKSTADKFNNELHQRPANFQPSVQTNEEMLLNLVKLNSLIEKEKSLLSNAGKPSLHKKQFADLKNSIQLIEENLDNFFVIPFLGKGKSKKKKDD